MNAAPSPSQESTAQASGAALWWRGLAPRERAVGGGGTARLAHAARRPGAAGPAGTAARANAGLGHRDRIAAGHAGHRPAAGAGRPGPDRVTVSLTGVSPGVLGPWLEEVRRTARARPLEANLTRGPDGFSGTLVLGLGSGGGSP